MGYRFRLHGQKLPGRPDIVLPKYKTVIFVHGCFWHRHACEAGQSTPATRVEYWNAKFARNVERDRLNLRRLRRMGWRVLVVWECQLKDKKSLARRVTRFLEERNA
jgi:DNA mismatch endonuclease (patch repair protein)